MDSSTAVTTGRVDGVSAFETPSDSAVAMLVEGKIFLVVGGVAFLGRGLLFKVVSDLKRSSNVDAREATELEAPGDDGGADDDAAVAAVDVRAVESCVEDDAGFEVVEDKAGSRC